MTGVPLDKARLRRALRRLLKIPAVGDEAEIAQESLDFLALLAGLKPVYVLGRGFDDPVWIDGVRALATEYRLNAVTGPLWQPDEHVRALPEWYAKYMRAGIAAKRAAYISKTRATHAAVLAACATGTPTIAEEARLLGFPECCVAAHYERVRAFHSLVLAILSRRTGGDADAMQTLLANGEKLVPEYEEERAAYDRAIKLRPGPFTSLNLCAPCSQSTTSPGMRIVERYGDLAAAIDPDYFAVLALD